MHKVVQKKPLIPAAKELLNDDLDYAVKLIADGLRSSTQPATAILGDDLVHVLNAVKVLALGVDDVNQSNVTPGQSYEKYMGQANDGMRRLNSKVDFKTVASALTISMMGSRNQCGAEAEVTERLPVVGQFLKNVEANLTGYFKQEVMLSKAAATKISRQTQLV